MLLAELPDEEIVKVFKGAMTISMSKSCEGRTVRTADPADTFDTGTIGSESMKRMIRERDYGEFTEIMADAVAQVYDVFARMQDPRQWTWYWTGRHTGSSLRT